MFVSILRIDVGGKPDFYAANVAVHGRVQHTGSSWRQARRVGGRGKPERVPVDHLPRGGPHVPASEWTVVFFVERVTPKYLCVWLIDGVNKVFKMLLTYDVCDKWFIRNQLLKKSVKKYLIF